MNFDLNIHNYSKSELLDLFELPPNPDPLQFEMKEAKLRESILSSTKVSPQIKTNTLEFLSSAKLVLFSPSSLNHNQLQPPTSTPLQKKIEEFYNSSYELKTTELEAPTEHMVQTRTNKPYLSSYPSEFFPGIINPIKKRTIKKNLNIDSRFRDNYYTSAASNFTLQLPLNINGILQMQLTSIELPTTYYVVSKQYGNNYFTIRINQDTTCVITIPSGNYDESGIMNIINTQLDMAGIPVVFAINIDNKTNGSAQTMVSPSSSSSIPITNIELDFQANMAGLEDHNTPLPLKFGWLLGFRNGKYTGTVNYVSEGLVDMMGPRYCYLVVDDYTNSVNNQFYSAFNSSILNKNILARISLQAPTFQIVQQNNLNITTTPRDYFGPINLQNMTVQLLDEYGRILDLNNMDFSFCLLMTTVYDI